MKNKHYMDVRLFWDGDDLGPAWMNIDNLKMVLFGQSYVKPELLAVAELDHSEHPRMTFDQLKAMGLVPTDAEWEDLERHFDTGWKSAMELEALLEALAEDEDDTYDMAPAFEIGECAVHKLTGTCVMVLDIITYSLDDNSVGFHDGYWVRFQDDKEPRKVFDFELMKRE